MGQVRNKLTCKLFHVNETTCAEIQMEATLMYLVPLFTECLFSGLPTGLGNLFWGNKKLYLFT